MKKSTHFVVAIYPNPKFAPRKVMDADSFHHASLICDDLNRNGYRNGSGSIKIRHEIRMHPEV